MSCFKFKKGHIPWNKGKKGIHLSKKSEFKKGFTPWNKGLTKKTDKRILKEAMSRRGKNNPIFRSVKKFGNYKSGYYKGYYMRSGWEIKYAKYLDKNKIDWKYESMAFNLGSSFYIPDFYLVKQNKYIEIKGRWLGDAKRKFNRFKKLYPFVGIEVLEGKELKKLGII